MYDMNQHEPTGRYRPISAWGYVGYNILFCIPVIGLICLLIFTFSSENINRRNYARSFWCVLLLAVIIVVVLLVAGVSVGSILSAIANR